MTSSLQGAVGGQATQPRRFFDSDFLHFARNSSWSVAGTTVMALCLFAETVVLARYFGVRTFGVYVLVIAYPEAVQLFFDFRTREAMTKYLGGALARDERERAVAVVKLLFLVDLGVILIAFVVVVLTAPVVAPHLTDEPSSVSIMRVYAIAMLLGSFDTAAGAVLRVFDRYRLAFSVTTLSVVLRLLVIVAIVMHGAAIEGIVWGRVVAELMATLIIGSAACVLLKQALWKHRGTRLATLREQRREIFHFLVHMNVQGSIRAAATKLDVLSVGAIAGPGAASLYKIGVQFGSSPLLLADPLFVSVYPAFSRWHALGQFAEIRAVGRKATIALSVVAIPTALILVGASPDLLGFVVGSAYRSAWPAMAVIMIGSLPAVVLFWGRAAMLASGDARAATTIVATVTVVQFMVLFLLTPLYGATGAAAGVAAMSIVATAMTLVYLRRKEFL